MALDIDALWDFSNPQLSEQRFREALEHADGDAALILQTQIARTHGIRGDFQAAQEVLAQLSRSLQAAGPEVRIRHAIEMGRTYASAAHGPDQLTTDNVNKARALYISAYEMATSASLDALAIDALHMMAFVDSDPEDQLAWANKALAVAKSSDHPHAKRWEASLRNNAGFALHQLGRYEAALVEFEAAVALREKASDEWAIHVAHWMVAWTLRALERFDEALEIQLRLERERDAAGRPDQHVFEELELLYRSKSDSARAAYYGQKAKKFAG